MVRNFDSFRQKNEIGDVIKVAKPDTEPTREQCVQKKIMQDYAILVTALSELAELKARLSKLSIYHKRVLSGAFRVSSQELSYQKLSEDVVRAFAKVKVYCDSFEDLTLFKKHRQEVVGNYPDDSAVRHYLEPIKRDFFAELERVGPTDKKHGDVGRFSRLEVDEVMIPAEELREVAVARAIGEANIPEKKDRQDRWNAFIQQLLLIKTTRDAAAEFLRKQNTKTALALIDNISQPILKHSSDASRVTTTLEGYLRKQAEKNTLPEYDVKNITEEEVASIILRIDRDVVQRVKSDMPEFCSFNTGEFFPNPESVSELGLERVEVLGNYSAQAIVDGIMSGAIPLRNLDDYNVLAQRWQREIPDVPLPAIPEDDNFEYLNKLAAHMTTKYFTGGAVENRPQFGSNSVLFVDSWVENDYESLTARSKILERLGLDDGAVNRFSRQQVERALWVKGDDRTRRPTSRHQHILDELGLPEGYEFRLIRHDEYARLAAEKKYDTKNLATHFEGYIYDNDRSSFPLALYGGCKDFGWARRDYSDSGDNKGGVLAFRLVLAKKEVLPPHDSDRTFSVTDTDPFYVVSA